MNNLSLIPKLLACLGIVALLAGCRGAQSGSIPQSAMKTQGRAHRESGSSGDLIYAATQFSAPQGGVLVLSYPSGTLESTITGLEIPGGLCSDRSGNVFVTDFKAATIVEYAHGGTNPINTLNDPGYFLGGCSVDVMTGSLAVSGFDDHGHGTVAIYPNAQGTPTIYSAPTDAHYCSYDKQGNLFVDGNESGGELAELRKGGSMFEAISLNQSIKYAGSLQWDGTELALAVPLGAGRQKGPTTIYRVKVSGTTGTVVGTTLLYNGKTNHNSGVEVQYWLQLRTIIGADGRYAKIGLWRYPQGGYPTHVIRQDTNGYGITVSVAPSSSHVRE